MIKICVFPANAVNLRYSLSHCLFKAAGIKRRLLDRWREAGPTQLDSTSLIGSPLELLISSLRNWYARAGNTHGERGDASRALCMLTFCWKIGDKDGYQVLSDTRHIKRKNVSVLEEPRVPSPLSTSATWRVQREGDPDWPLPSRLQAEEQQPTAPSSSHSSFLVVESPATLEIGRREGSSGRGGSVGGHLPALLLPAPAKGLSPASKACPETLWNRKLIFHAEQDEIPTVTSFTSQCCNL